MRRKIWLIIPLLLALSACKWNLDVIPDEEIPSPIITQLIPNHGREGDTLTIEGQHFGEFIQSRDQVTLSGIPVVLTEQVTDTRISFKVPTDVTDGEVAVRINGQRSDDKGPGPRFTYDFVIINRLVPDHGVAGESIQLRGQFFRATPNDNHVTFPGLNTETVQATVTAATDTSLTVTIPEAADHGEITVTVDGRSGKSPTFTYDGVQVTGLVPANGVAGDPVRIKGHFFRENSTSNQVFFTGSNGEIAVPVTSATDSSLEVNVPSGAITGPVRVVVDERSNSSPAPFQYNAVQVSSISPDHGKFGTVVTLSGQFFATGNPQLHSVQFNGVVAQVNSATATSLTVVVPIGAGTGAVSVSVNERQDTGPVYTYELTATDVSTLAGSGSPGFLEGFGTSAQFDFPTGITVDPNGNIYVADANNNRIRLISPSGNVSTFAGNTDGTFFDDTGIFARFNSPRDVVSDSDGNIYVADGFNFRIRKITPSQVVTTLAGSTFGHADGSGSNAKFKLPWAIGIDANKNLYITDQFDQRIRKVTQNGAATTLAGTGQSGFADSPAPVQFKDPSGIVATPSGVLFVGDAANHRIRKIEVDGTVNTFAGNGLPGLGNATGTAAQFSLPNGIARDSEGNLYVADRSNHVIRMINPDGEVSTFAGTGTIGSSNGEGDEASFNQPYGLAIDENANPAILYVADTENHVIRKIIME